MTGGGWAPFAPTPLYYYDSGGYKTFFGPGSSMPGTVGLVSGMATILGQVDTDPRLHRVRTPFSAGNSCTGVICSLKGKYDNPGSLQMFLGVLGMGEGLGYEAMGVATRNPQLGEPGWALIESGAHEFITGLFNCLGGNCMPIIIEWYP